MFNLDDCICFLTSKGAKQLSDVLEKRISAYGITRVQWIAMYYIDLGNDLSQRGLADILGIKEPTVARLIDRCEKEGLVRRKNLANDKRKKVLELTERGKNLNEKLILIAEKFMNDAIKGIKMEDLQIYKNVIEKMLSNFDEENCIGEKIKNN